MYVSGCWPCIDANIFLDISAWPKLIMRNPLTSHPHLMHLLEMWQPHPVRKTACNVNHSKRYAACTAEQRDRYEHLCAHI